MLVTRLSLGLAYILPHRGKCWRYVCGELQIVESDNADIERHVQATCLQCSHCADGDDVGYGEHAIKFGAS